jgi:hypothetical protein
VARKTTTTTTTESRKDSSGAWEEYHRTVTTVVERDDEGYPWGPLTNLYLGLDYGKRRYGGRYGDFLSWYDSFGARPASKPEKPEQEDGQDG